jgi:hypothetical protein
MNNELRNTSKSKKRRSIREGQNMCVKGDSMELLILHRESPWKTAT